MKTKSITSELIQELLSVAEAPCISLYMSTHRSHPENAQDIIRYKNLVKQVKESLEEKYPTTEIQKLLEPFETLANDNEFWKYTSDGLGVLASQERFEVIQLQMPVEELVIVSDRFHTKPLRHFLQSADRHQVLALSMDTFQLFEGNRHSLVEIELPDDFPKTIEEALGGELTDKHTTVASYGGVGGHSTTMHHGQGGKMDEVDSDGERFFRVVAAAVYERYSKHSELPLILAALPEHRSLFYQVNKNPYLLPKGIDINPQSVPIEKLAHLSWEAIQPVYTEKLETLIGKFNQAKSDGLGSDNLVEVIEAAEAGKVDTILIEANRLIASKPRDKMTDGFEMTDSTLSVSDDQLDILSELVSKMGGSVVIVPIEQMPSQTGLAATFRY